MEYAAGAARFLTGTPNPAAHYAGTAGYDLIEEIGVERIRENSLRQTHLLIDLADAAGFEVHSTREPARRGGAVIVDVPRRAAVYAELEARGILGDFRPGAGIRLGPHFFTTDDELRFAVAQIAEIVETGAFERHARRGRAALDRDACRLGAVADLLGLRGRSSYDPLDVPANEREVPPGDRLDRRLVARARRGAAGRRPAHVGCERRPRLLRLPPRGRAGSSCGGLAAVRAPGGKVASSAARASPGGRSSTASRRSSATTRSPTRG